MFVELPISGLHRLFNGKSSARTLERDQASLTAITEEVHTRDLLYPTREPTVNIQSHAPIHLVGSSLDPRAADAFDEWNELGLDGKDIRVLVAQDGQQPRVLYDSREPGRHLYSHRLQDVAKQAHTQSVIPKGQSRSIPLQEGRFGSPITSSRRTALGPEISTQASPAHESGRMFVNPTYRGTSEKLSPDGGENSKMKVNQEWREQLDILLECMFGSSGLPLISSTKIHVNPLVTTTQTRGMGTSPKVPELGLHRSSPKKRTPLNRSTTSAGLERNTRSLLSADTGHSEEGTGGSSMLITRVFSVEKPSPVITDPASHEPKNLSEPVRSFAENDIEKMKQVKIPVYAVALLLRMPHTKPLHHHIPPKSEKLFSRSCEDSYLYITSSNSSLGASSTEYDLERVTAHWSILTRALSLLEKTARIQIQRLLSEATQYRPSKNNAPNLNTTTLRSKSKQSSQRVVQLLPLALQESHDVTSVVDMVRYRISHAMRIRRVTAGQGRWGVWRDETRWVSRWANGKEQNFFFFNILTAFLGNHMEWLEHLGVGWNVCSQVQQDIDEAHPLRNRTVIISTDKMSARRLIFLLSTFLPETTIAAHKGKSDRPYSSRSSSGFSRSPPVGVPLSREVSLRRTINRRPRDQRAPHQIHTHERSVSFSTAESLTDADQLAKLPGHHRRTSDARSVRSLALPIPLGTQGTRKTSISTTSTPIQWSDVPTPQFSGFSSDRPGTSAAPRPGSSGSLASLSLRRTLSRSDSSGGALSLESPTTSRWGSMLSGFWSARGASSTEGTEGLASPPDGLGNSGMPHSTSPRSPSKLAQMVEEVAHRPSITGESDQDTLQGPPSPVTITEATPAKDIPERPKMEDFPLKLSVDAKDGVVDIDLPATASYPSSFVSSMDSPQMINSASSSFNDHSSLYGRTSTHSSLSPEHGFLVHVAGYLPRYHQDFTLQAVRPYETLKEEIKRSMLEEPMSAPRSSSTHEWTDVCTTLIADSSTFTVTRLVLRRNKQSEERFTEEPVMDLDPTLTNAVEGITIPSSPDAPAKHQDDTQQGTTSLLPDLSRHDCKKLMMGALEEVAKSVINELDDREGGREIGVGKGRATGVLDSSLREGVRRCLRERSGR